MYLTMMSYEISSERHELERKEQLYSVIREALGDIYAMSPPCILRRFAVSYTPSRGGLYVYTKEKPKKKEYINNDIILNIDSSLDIKKLILDALSEGERDLEKDKTKVAFEIVTPMILSPIAVYMGKEIQLPAGPYPDIISGLIKLGRDLKISDLEEIVAKGFVRVVGFKGLKTIKVDRELYGVKGIILAEFLERAVPLKDVFQSLPFIPMGSYIEKGYGVAILRELQ